MKWFCKFLLSPRQKILPLARMTLSALLPGLHAMADKIGAGASEGMVFKVA